MSGTNDAVAARRQVLDGLDQAGLARLLAAVPVFADALRGRGPLAPTRLVPRHGLETFAPPRSRAALAALAASRPGVVAAVSSLDWFHLRLLAVALVHDGVLTRAVAEAEVGTSLLDRVEQAADLLAERLLVVSGDGSDQGANVLFTVLPGVADVLGLPGIRLADGVEPITSDMIATALRLLGEPVTATRKADRVASLRAVLSDPDRIAAVRRAMPPASAEILDLLLDGPVAFSDLEVYWYPDDTRYRDPRLESPFHWLADRLLAWADPYQDIAFTWLEVQTAVRGRIYDDWEAEPPPGTPEPIDDPGPFLPPTLTRLEALLDRWADQPAPALKSGGIGVRAVRAAATALGVDAVEVALLAHLAAELGLLGVMETGPATGRGRLRDVPMGWAPTRLRERWAELPAARRWVLLVRAWVDATEFNETVDGLPNKVGIERFRMNAVRVGGDAPAARRAVLDTLAALPDGCGLEPGALAGRAWWLHPADVDVQEAAGVLAAARILGLVPPDGPAGLTTLGRLVLIDPDRVAEVVNHRTGALTVQADLTVLVPPDTAPEVAARLERYADLESDAGVRVYRLAEQRIGAALTAGDAAEEIESFLVAHSGVEVPQNVRYLVHDVARTHGKLRAGAAASYLRCDDPALLAQAAGHRTARLRVLAPTVAVSTLSRARLIEVLRAKGLALVAEDPDGATVVAGGHVAPPRVGAPTALPTPDPVWPAPDAVADVATDLFATAGEPVGIDRFGRWVGQPGSGS